jgi:hypothetical protein
MYGRQHLQMLTCEFEREAQASSKITNGLNGTQSNTMQVSQGITTPTICHSSISIPQFTETFLDQNLSK